jgi:hypothetical protein
MAASDRRILYLLVYSISGIHLPDKEIVVKKMNFVIKIFSMIASDKNYCSYVEICHGQRKISMIELKTVVR